MYKSMYVHTTYFFSGQTTMCCVNYFHVIQVVWNVEHHSGSKVLLTDSSLSHVEAVAQERLQTTGNQHRQARTVA